MNIKKCFIKIISILCSVLLIVCIKYFNYDINKISSNSEPTIIVEKKSMNPSIEIVHTLSKDDSIKENIHTEKKDFYQKLLSEIPDFSGDSCFIVNGDIPYFTDDEKNIKIAFENYSELDNLGRCGIAYANLSRELMPTEKRGEIGHIKPSGWNQAKYNTIKESESNNPGYLYNRCHLIGFQLAGENDNEKNLVTGTRFMNIGEMLNIENRVANYIKETNNHVLYRVTPVFIDKELVCRGILIEAYSIEDMGEGIELCVYCYNVQPGIIINYSTGESKESSF